MPERPARCALRQRSHDANSSRIRPTRSNIKGVTDRGGLEPDTPGNQIGRPGQVFVGRDRQLRTLQQAFDTATSGGSSVVTVAGEPGVGKSSLLDQFADSCASEHVHVCRARCWDGDGSPEYWPWLQVAEDLRSWAPEHASALQAALGPENSGDLSARPSGQVRRFDTVARALEATADRPLVVMVDDLQWADGGSLALTRFIAGATRDWPLLIVLAYRDTEPSDEQLRQTLAAVGRARGHRHIQLEGLADAEVSDLVSRVLHIDEPAPDFVRVLTDAANGNALYITQLLRMAADDPSLASSLRRGELSPKGPIVDLILDRVDALQGECRGPLEVASVIGRQFEVDVLVASADEPSLARTALDEAERAGLLIASSAGTRQFAHDVIRSVLYEQIGSSRRADLHATVAITLEQARGRGGSDTDALLAHHHMRTGTVEGCRRARAYARSAARHAASRSAHHDAARFYALASELRDHEEPDADSLAEAIGESRSRFHAGELKAARAAALRGVEIARLLTDAVGLAESAICLSRPGSRFLSDIQAIVIVREALAGLPETETTRHLMLEACLCWELQFDDPDRTRALSARLLADARALGDPNVMTYALIARRYAIWSADDLDELLTIGDDLVEIGSGIEEPELESQGHYTHRSVCLDLGDMAGADANVHAVAGLADRYQLPGLEAWVHGHRALRLALEGDLDASEAALVDAMVLSASTEDEQMLLQFAPHQVLLARERLRLDEAAGLLSVAAAMRPRHPLAAAGSLHLDLLAGVSVDPRRLGDVLDRCADRPSDWLWLGAIAEAMCCASLLEDGAAARRLHALLAPYSRDRKTVMVGATVCLGAAAYFAGLGALVMGELTLAAEHLQISLEVNDAIGHRPQLARTHLQLARLARTRRDERAAASHAATARAIAAPLAIPRLDREASDLADEDGPIPGRLTARESQFLTMVAQGLTNRQMAASVHLSEKTIERHLGNVYTKLGVRNRAEASAWAVRNLPDQPS
jgi:DNA-binding CsgD family transcriptional regulator